ncbi:MAG: HD domain-containing protein, partial [Candidatus Tectomicrobia bacterium]|nr:HD domain-containing protein [Candidatus Tectomicrobia bacterium]
YRALIEAFDFLMRIRNELHFRHGRRDDILSFADEEPVAIALRYQGTEKTSAAEQIMQDYYRHALNVYRITSLAIKQCTEKHSPLAIFGKKLSAQSIEPGISLRNGELYVETGAIFHQDLSTLIRLFLHSQRLNCHLGEETRNLIRFNLHLIDEEFRTLPEVREIFLTILRSREHLAKTIRLLHETGFLGSYIPEFGQLTHLVRYDTYHDYTVDEHTLIALENLESLRRIEGAEGSEFARILDEIKQPELLHIAILFHDLGKVEKSDHIPESVKLTGQALSRLNIEGEERERIVFLVKSHLLMSHTAQRRDLDDEKVIEQFAREMGDVENLKMLLLLTYADISAVGPGVWTHWKGAILWQLYNRARIALEEVREEVGAKKAHLLAETIRHLLPSTISPEEIWQQISRMPTRYLENTPLEKIRDHILLVKELNRNPMVITHSDQKGYGELTVCTWDRPHLFADITGALTYHGVNILNAQIFTRDDGVVVDVFQVTREGGGTIGEEGIWKRLSDDLEQVLKGEKNVGEMVSRYRRRIFIRRKKRETSLPPYVYVDNELSERYTVIEIQAEDRMGLLYDLARTLSELGLNIYLALISTDLNRAIDVFYMTDVEGKKIAEHEEVVSIQKTLFQILSGKS